MDTNDKPTPPESPKLPPLSASDAVDISFSEMLQGKDLSYFEHPSQQQQQVDQQPFFTFPHKKVPSAPYPSSDIQGQQVIPTQKPLSMDALLNSVLRPNESSTLQHADYSRLQSDYTKLEDYTRRHPTFLDPALLPSPPTTPMLLRNIPATSGPGLQNSFSSIPQIFEKQNPEMEINGMRMPSLALPQLNQQHVLHNPLPLRPFQAQRPLMPSGIHSHLNQHQQLHQVPNGNMGIISFNDLNSMALPQRPSSAPIVQPSTMMGVLLNSSQDGSPAALASGYFERSEQDQHPDGQQRTKMMRLYKCPKPFCTKVYKNANGLKYHMDHGSCELDSTSNEAEILVEGQVTREQIEQSNVRITKRPYWCRVPGCGKKYKNLNGLKYHARIEHTGLDFRRHVKGHHAHRPDG